MGNVKKRVEADSLEQMLKAAAKETVERGFPADAVLGYLDYFIHTFMAELEGVQMNGRPNASVIAAAVGSNRVRARFHLQGDMPDLVERSNEMDYLWRVFVRCNERFPKRKILKRSEFRNICRELGKDISPVAVEKAGKLRGLWEVDRLDGEVRLLQSPGRR